MLFYLLRYIKRINYTYTVYTPSSIYLIGHYRVLSRVPLCYIVGPYALSFFFFFVVNLFHFLIPPSHLTSLPELEETKRTSNPIHTCPPAALQWSEVPFTLCFPGTSSLPTSFQYDYLSHKIFRIRTFG